MFSFSTCFRRRRRSDRLEVEYKPPAMALQEALMLQSTADVAGGSGFAPKVEPNDEYPEVDHFEDAIDDIIDFTSGASMSLNEAMSDCQRAIDRFFNNDLTEAAAIMQPWRNVSLYHAHGAAIFDFIPALLTLEPAQIQKAQESVLKTFELYTKERKSSSFLGTFMKRPKHGAYTDPEAHAELIYSEALLLQACLTALEGDELSGLLKASFRVKSSYDCYRTCSKILNKKKWENEQSQIHFESGVRLGIATFNVVVAMLPPKVITLLEFVGFSANKEKGISELIVGATSPGMRSVLCQLTLLIYFLVIGQFAGIPPDFDAAELIIISGLRRYPNSVWFLMFNARLQLLRGMIEESVVAYQSAARATSLWPQLKHVTYWEMIWANAIMLKWDSASNFAKYLGKYSKWSKTVYTYTEAAMLMELGHLNSLEENKRNADLIRQKILGRSIPLEKFVMRRCERWSRRGYLVLPGVELICLWNIFPCLALNPHFADLMLKLIEQTSTEVRSVISSKQKIDSERRFIPPYDTEDLALVNFLQGSLLAAMSLPRLAIRHLDAVIKVKDDLKDNAHLLPFATVEIAMCHYTLGDMYKAEELLQDARKKYSGYLLESRLQFRIHAKLELVHVGILRSAATAAAANAAAADAAPANAAAANAAAANAAAANAAAANAAAAKAGSSKGAKHGK